MGGVIDGGSNGAILLFFGLILLGLTLLAIFSAAAFASVAVAAATIGVGLALTTGFALMGLSLIGAIGGEWCSRGLALSIGTILGQTAVLLLADLIALELAGYWLQILLNSSVIRVGGSALGWYDSRGVCG
jgi:hypothetical protein